MAKLEKLSATSWRQLFKDRKKEFHLWKSQNDVARLCDLQDSTKRLLRISFEKMHKIDIIDKFQITSGKEISFPKPLQELIKPIVIANPNSYFDVTILDTTTDDEYQSNTLTESIATIKTRLGQQEFREKLIKYWGCCAISNISLTPILKASHIKPWSMSNDFERLDEFNGLLLSPLYDDLFDKGYISFKDDGSITISPTIANHLHVLQINETMKLMKINPHHIPYLSFHRDNIFIKC